MIHQHHADGLRPRLAREVQGAQACEIEPRHDVGDDHDLVAVQLANACVAVGGVGDRQHRIGVGVIDVFVRQDGVQNRLDRRRRRRHPGHVRDQLVHHLRVAEGFEPRQPQQMRQAHRREAGRLDELQIPAAALHIQDVFLVAEQIALADLHRGVAPAVQDERLVASKQTRGIHPEPQVVAELGGFRILPQTVHPLLLGYSSNGGGRCRRTAMAGADSRAAVQLY